MKLKLKEDWNGQLTQSEWARQYTNKIYIDEMKEEKTNYEQKYTRE